MTSAAIVSLDQQPHVARLGALAPLTPREEETLRAMVPARSVPARREIVASGAPVPQASLLLAGWAARVRDFRDGRRQILHLMLPGDLIDFSQQGDVLAPTTIVALTGVALAPAPLAGSADSGLGQAYALCATIGQACLFRQIARVGRLDAYERLADLFLELNDRLELAGLASGGGFPLPLTQEMLADVLGLTSVHVNRTLQLMRREGVLEIRGSLARLVDAPRLRSVVDYQPIASTIGRD